jgi:hypothetical protein
LGGGGGDLSTDAAQNVLFERIPAKTKKLGLLSIYKFSLVCTVSSLQSINGAAIMKYKGKGRYKIHLNREFMSYRAAIKTL